MNKSDSIDDYIKTFSKETRDILQQVRATIKEAASEVQEGIKYGIPTFILNENLVHFGAYKQHIGFYPTPDVIVAFKKELSDYETAKGSVQFPFDKPVPLELIKQMVAFRVAHLQETKPLKKNKQ